MSKSILLIEADPTARAIHAAMLRFVGFAVLEAGDAASGIRTAREQRPDLLMIDLDLPGVDGWEALRALRGDERTSGIPAVALTRGRCDPGRLEDAGFCGELRLPLAPFRVVEEAERCLGSLDESVPEVDARREESLRGEG